MSQHSQERMADQVAILASDDFHTRYAGVIALQRLWQQLNVSGCLAEREIRYGQGRDRASSFAFALTLGPLVQANSVRKVAQRFGGEPSPQAAEVDKLLRHLVPAVGDQRTMSRFVNQARYDWSALRAACIEQWQGESPLGPITQLQAEGVLIVDDFPVPKPYARAMDYLERVWDANQERNVPGYHVVHCYYHHPTQPSYSLCFEPWRKTSRTGETDAKPPHAYRRARAGEERSKLAIALAHLEALRPRLRVPVPVIFDGWYFARWFVAALTELGYGWITQAGVQRKFAVAAGYLSVPEIVERYRDQLEPVPLADRTVLAYAMPAILPPDKYTRQAQPVQLVLVRGFLAHDEEDDFRLLVCNRRDWSRQQILTRFGYRTQIEQAHRTGKQLAGWTEFHSRSWASQKAHWTLAWLRSLLLALLPFAQPALQEFSLAQIIQLGLQAAARFVTTSTRMAMPAIYRPRDQPVLQACLL